MEFFIWNEDCCLARESESRHCAFLDYHGQIIKDVLQMIKLKVHFWKWCEFYYVRTNLTFCCDILIHLLKVKIIQTLVFTGISSLELKGNDGETPCACACWCTCMKMLPFAQKSSDEDPKKMPLWQHR